MQQAKLNDRQPEETSAEKPTPQRNTTTQTGNLQLTSLLPAAIDKATTKVEPSDGLQALIELLGEVEKRMIANGIEFDNNKMPGKKQHLFDVGRKLYPVQLNKALETFDGYLEGKCKFKQGRHKNNAKNPYAELFPELFL